MPYSSSLTDEEWEILEPLLPQILPVKKQTRPWVGSFLKVLVDK
jgi:transposase